MDAVAPLARDEIALPERAALTAALTAIAQEGNAAEGRARARVLEQVKATLNAGRAGIRAAFEAGASARVTMRASAALFDDLIGALLDVTAECIYPAANPTTGDRICLVAVGGYGRNALAPHSDIDLLFLLPYKKTPRGEQIVEYALYMLWDAGLKVGHATRSVEDTMRLSREDVTIRTSVLEARWLWGDGNLYDELRARFAKEVVAGSGPAFVEAKLAERDQRHQRMGDSRYVVEPNVKEGKGGLRDLQTLYWIAKYLYRVDDIADVVEKGVLTRAEAARFEKAEEFLNTVRAHLHYLTNRPDDRLTFDVQIDIAARLGYADRPGSRGVERFMKHYHLTAKDVGDLTRIFCAALEAEHQRKPTFSLSRLWTRSRTLEGFRVDGGRLSIASPTLLKDDPINILRLFHTAQRHELDIHPQALRLVTRHLRLIDAGLRASPEAGRMFLEMLTSRMDPETTLRRMSEAGVLGRFIPAFGRVIAQMQYDMYHTYTVDEHTIRAIGILHRIERGELAEEVPVTTEVMKKIISRRALYIAVFLHDIAKGRGRDHSELGAEIARDLCPRLGLDAEETETVAWLVLRHLLMSATAFKRDLSDPKTVRDFADVVRSPERLRLLHVLTTADIRAVGPNVWNGWKAGLLRELYFKADELLSGTAEGTGNAARVKAVQDEVRHRLADWPAADVERVVSDAPAGYWLAVAPEMIVRHARMIRSVMRDETKLVIEPHVDTARAVTELTICTYDHPGLFSRIAGGIAVAGGNIVEARIFTMLNGIALDTFWIQEPDDTPFDRPERLSRLIGRIEQALAGKINTRAELRRQPPWPTRTAVFTVPPRVLIDNKASATHTVIEVNGRDRSGFLSDVTRTLAAQSLQISTARISTYGEQAVDVFYVKDLFGLKVEHETKLRQVREALLEAIGDPSARRAAKRA